MFVVDRRRRVPPRDPERRQAADPTTKINESYPEAGDVCNRRRYVERKSEAIHSASLTSGAIAALKAFVTGGQLPRALPPVRERPEPSICLRERQRQKLARGPRLRRLAGLFEISLPH